MPEVGLQVGDNIGAADIALEGNEIHVVWLTQLHDGNSRLSYRRLNPETGRWSAVTSVATDVGGPLRLLQADGQLHIVAGQNLQHFISSNGGAAWQRLPDLLPKSFALALDATTDGGAFVLAYLVRKRSPQGDSIEVWTATWSKRRAVDRSLVGALPGGPTQPDPKLVFDRGEYRLFGAINQVAKPAPPGELSEHGRLFCARSGDKGVTWAPPSVLGVLGIIDRRARPEGNGYVSHLDALRLGNRFYLLYNAGWLYMTSSADGSRWSPTSVLVGASTWVGSAPNSSVAVAAWQDRGRVVWIDERFQRTDRSLLNPFGLHWLVDPNWSNNDVLSMPLSVLGGPPRTEPVKPTRLTRDLSFAIRVRARAAPTRIYALWIGRAKVGRELDSYGSPPSIFIASMPLD